MTTEVKGPWFEVPAGTSAAKCQSCGRMGYWITTPNNKRLLIDCAVEGGRAPWRGVPGDGEVTGRGIAHFATCPDADKWRKRK